MTPYFNTISALLKVQQDSLNALDPEGSYECLDVGCCGNQTDQFTNWFVTTTLLLQYLLSGGTLPTFDGICCQPICGQYDGVSPDIFTSPTFTDLTVTDNLTVGDDTVMTGDLTLGGAFTRASVVQPIYRSGTGTLSGGTLVIAAPWVTANTAIVVSYNTASAAGQANISRGTIIPATSFAVNGEGTNTFTWIAIQNA